MFFFCYVFVVVSIDGLSVSPVCWCVVWDVVVSRFLIRFDPVLSVVHSLSDDDGDGAVFVSL